MRVGIEGYYSSFERIFGDEVRSRNPCCAEHEIRLKVANYNDMIDMAESNDHTGKRILLPSRGDAGGGSGGAGATGVCRAVGSGGGRPAGTGQEAAGSRKASGGGADCGPARDWSDHYRIRVRLLGRTVLDRSAFGS